MSHQHVRLKRTPTKQDLIDMGINSQNSIDALKEGAVFGVERKSVQPNGTLVYLEGAPLNPGKMLWVWDHFVEDVTAPANVSN